MAETLESHPPGRPSVPLDAEKAIEVKDMLSAYEAFRAGGGKKNRKEQKVGKRQSVE